jgi:hypothetical protein
MKFFGGIGTAFVFLSILTAQAKADCVSTVDRTVVMLDVTSPRGNEHQYGAGVIFAIQGADIFITTAAHVVKMKEPRMNVYFFGDREKPYSVQIANANSSLDVAFLVVRDGALASSLRQELDWHLLPSSIGAPTPEYAIIVGNNGGQGWSRPTAPERIISNDARDIIIDSRATRPGSSGGAVFDPNDQLLGIVYSDEYGQAAQAFSIARVLKEARRLGLPVNLSENRLSTPAVYIPPVRGAPGNWGRDIANSVRQKLERIRRVIDCQNGQAIAMIGNVEIRSPTMTTDVAVITWRFTGEMGIASAPVTQYIEIPRLPWKHVSEDPDMLASKTNEAADFAVVALTNNLAR